jgi:hypothetical protein
MAKRERKIQMHPLSKPSVIKKIDKALKKLKEEKERERLKKAS